MPRTVSFLLKITIFGPASSASIVPKVERALSHVWPQGHEWMKLGKWLKIEVATDSRNVCPLPMTADVGISPKPRTSGHR